MSNLFTTVSVEQQAIVSGGFDQSFSQTFLSGVRANQKNGSISTFGGSEAGGIQQNERVNTGGLNVLAADAPPTFTVIGLGFPVRA